jgi:hypothetical protein
LVPAKRNSRAFQNGSLLASVLTGSWRSSPPSVDEESIEALDLTVTALLRSGTAALAWWRLRKSVISTTASAIECRRAYVFQTLEAERRGSSLAKAFHLFRSAGIEPISVIGLQLTLIFFTVIIDIRASLKYLCAELEFNSDNVWLGSKR